MAVTTTPMNIIEAAYAKSMKSNPGAIATESGELLQLVIRSMRNVYQFAARINPIYFAESVAVAFSSGGWPRPENAVSIWRIENPSGAEVVVVPFDHRTAEIHKPAVYEFGQVYRSAGNANDPTSGNLTFFYSKRPSTPANLAATIDAQWNEDFNELLILDVAVYLAIKDAQSGREKELGELKADRDAWVQRFAFFLEHATVNKRQSFGHFRRFNTNSMAPIASLFAGGTNVQVGG